MKERELLEIVELEVGGEVQEREVTSGGVLRGAALRFLPANLVMISGLNMLHGVSDLLPVSSWAVLALGQTLGFGAALLGLKTWLAPGAQVSGRRSLIAGLLATPAVFALSRLVWTTDPFGLALLGLATGAGVALSMYFPWLSGPAPTTEEKTMPAQAASE